ncbi:MAG: GNAT family N-acetyltransferase [Thalassobaculaceae bacterium]|nr:GNAT family N-acetyltransferase [Thalassobaculaceae bacterium]
MPVPALSPTIDFRPATQEDCAHLVLFTDMATSRFASYIWGQAAAPGQSAFEAGRSVIRNDASHFTHVSNWHVASRSGAIIGGLNGYVLPETQGPAPTVEAAVPLYDLKGTAAGTWYLSAVALYAEHQGGGLGAHFLAKAAELARVAGKDRLTLMVASFNPRAHSLYCRYGFREWDRRSYIRFSGSGGPGDWILMVKDLA